MSSYGSHGRLVLRIKCHDPSNYSQIYRWLRPLASFSRSEPTGIFAFAYQTIDWRVIPTSMLFHFTGYNCSFEGRCYAIYNVKVSDDFDWVLHSGPTTTPGTGPDADHTIGKGTQVVTFCACHLVYYCSPPKGEELCVVQFDSFCARLLVCLFTLSVFLMVCVFVFLFVCLFVFLAVGSICFPICLSICLIY